MPKRAQGRSQKSISPPPPNGTHWGCQSWSGEDRDAASPAADALSPQLFQSPHLLNFASGKQGQSIYFIPLSTKYLTFSVFYRFNFSFSCPLLQQAGLIYSDLNHFQIFGQNQFPLMKWPAVLDIVDIISARKFNKKFTATSFSSFWRSSPDLRNIQGVFFNWYPP